MFKRSMYFLKSIHSCDYLIYAFRLQFVRMSKELDIVEAGKLRDYDWKLQYVLGTSSLTNHQESLLVLDLHTIRDLPISSKAPVIHHSVSAELNKNDLDKLISTLESCQQKLLRSN